MNIKYLLLALVLGAFVAACGDDSPAGPAQSSPNDAAGPSETSAPTTIPAPGTIALSLEPVQGFFIEGFEIGIRFEDSIGQTIASTYWTDFVASLGEPSLEDYYESVLNQQVPAGRVTVLAEVAVGIGPPPVPPDLNGDLACSLEVDVEPGAVVEVEVLFSEAANCLVLKGA